MDRKGRLSCAVLICFGLSSCMDFSRTAEVEIILDIDEIPVKAELPDENRISDVGLFIYGSDGRLEYQSFDSVSSGRFQVHLLKEEKYHIYALINFGQKFNAETIEEMQGIEYHLVYPDEYRNGIPMCASAEVTIANDTRIELQAVRLMSKISVRMDRSRLSEEVRMLVSGIRIGNCPKKVKVFGQSRAESEDDCFASGFSHSSPQCSPLNTEGADRLSECISLYMLENMQGPFSDSEISSDENKVFEEYDRRNRTCSYIEIDMEYSSPQWSSMDKPLTYRFYLGEDRNSLDIERNCHYTITVCPEDDGLNGYGWRVDKSGLKYSGETSLEKYPSGYINGDIGDVIHIGCILTPSYAPFDVGIEYLEDDKAEGIYDYEIDKDGHGVTLTLTGPGSGLIYMEAGDPINEAALFIVEVNLPD